jgi:hypothetical protein
MKRSKEQERETEMDKGNKKKNRSRAEDDVNFMDEDEDEGEGGDQLKFSVLHEDSEDDSDLDEVDDVFGGNQEISAKNNALRKKSSSSSLGIGSGKRHLDDIKQWMGEQH